MPNTAKITGASHDITFADGTTYRMAPLTDRDISELDNWVRSRHIQIAIDAGKDLSDEDRMELKEVAMMQAATLSWMSGMGARLMATVDGMARLCWQGIKTNHPLVSLEDLRAKMFDPVNVDEANRVFEKLNLPDSSDDSKKGVGRERRRTQRKRTKRGRKRK